MQLNLFNELAHMSIIRLLEHSDHHPPNSTNVNSHALPRHAVGPTGMATTNELINALEPRAVPDDWKGFACLVPKEHQGRTMLFSSAKQPKCSKHRYNKHENSPEISTRNKPAIVEKRLPTLASIFHFLDDCRKR